MTENPYETQRYLDEYLLFHYGQARRVCPFSFIGSELLRFHERLRRECLLPIRAPGSTRALDIGCGVGRFTFELGRVANRALGLDSSRRFVDAARRMARDKALTVRVSESGGQFMSRRLILPRALRSSVVEFDTADALDLSALPEAGFQVVAAINLLCRLGSPRRFLQQTPRLVAPGGQLLIASPFSWLEQHTPRGQWLTSRQVRLLLRPHFRLRRRRDLPLVIREHRRKYQLIVSEVLVFQRAQ
ncbi:MAG: methyltransferase domain-containing protein [Verrucomicrobiota bacterium]